MSFKPAWWLAGAHLQTLWPTLCRRKIKLPPITRERFELPDGDFLDLDWVGTEGPIVIILHGLEGSIHSPYARGLLKTLAAQNCRGVIIHFRGMSGEPNRLARCYHSGDTADLALVIQHLHTREPETTLLAVGFSLGGNVLLKWLGETPHENPLTAAVAVSVPFELAATARRMTKGFSRVYQRHLLRKLKKRLTHKFHQHPSATIDLHQLKKVRTFFEFDQWVTAPLHGFAGATDYYAKASSRPYLKNITIPTLIIHAKDDPFMTGDVIPKSEELSSSVQLELTHAGGHVGFITGKFPWHPTYWLEERIPQFLFDHPLDRNEAISITKR